MPKPTTEPAFDVPAAIPGLLFFYGSLMDADVLKSITKATETPVLRKGWIEGFQVKMWGMYPTLIPQAGGRVDGMFWHIAGQEMFQRLRYYETDAYKPATCLIHHSDSDKVEKGATFIWADSADSSNLKDGTFDLGGYQKNFKPIMMRKW